MGHVSLSFPLADSFFFQDMRITYLVFEADKIPSVYTVPGTSKKPPAEEEDEEEELRKLQAEMAM